MTSNASESTAVNTGQLAFRFGDREADGDASMRELLGGKGGQGGKAAPRNSRG